MVIGTIGKAMVEFGGFFAESMAGRAVNSGATKLVKRLTPERIPNNLKGKAIRVTRKATPLVAGVGGQYLGHKLYWNGIVMSFKAFGIAVEEYFDGRSLPKKTVKVKDMKTEQIEEPEKVEEKKSKKKSKKEKKDK